MLKLVRIVLDILIICLVLISCKGEDGPVGPVGNSGIIGDKGDKGIDGKEGNPGKSLEYPIKGSISGTVSGILLDNSQYTESFNYIYLGNMLDKEGFNSRNMEQGVFGLSITRKEHPQDYHYYNNFLSLSFHCYNKGDENMRLELSHFHFRLERAIGNNKLLMLESTSWNSQFPQYEISDLSYDSVTGELYFIYKIDSIHLKTGKPISITGEVKITVFDDILL